MTKYLLLDGTETETVPESNYQYKIVGKTVVGEHSTRTFVVLLYGSILDVRKTAENEIKRYNSLPEYKQVPPDIYEKYVQYVRNEGTKVSIKSLEGRL